MLTPLRVDGEGGKTEYPPGSIQFKSELQRAVDMGLQLAAQPLVIAAANVDDVMMDQLEYLIEHARGGDCGCADCSRYVRVRKILMEPFAEPERVAKAGA